MIVAATPRMPPTAARSPTHLIYMIRLEIKSPRRPAVNINLFYMQRINLRFQRGKANDIVGALDGLLCPAGQNIEPTLVSQRLECTRETDDGLGCAEHKVCVVRHLPGDPVEHGGLGVLIEID